jgi:hypothetical protein
MDAVEKASGLGRKKLSGPLALPLRAGANCALEVGNDAIKPTPSVVIQQNPLSATPVALNK